MKAFIVLATLIVAVAAQYPKYPKPSYPKPSYPEPAYPKPSYEPSYPKPSYPSYKPSYKPDYDYAPMPYNFAWAVKDDYTYNDYGHQENNDGYKTTGSYYVQLPDGRLQTVNYVADENGYVADVSYKGEAKYDSYKPAYPAYKPEYPAYKPEYKPSYEKPAYKPAYEKPAYKPAYKPSYPSKYN